MEELNNPVLTPERLEAARAAAREKMLRGQARAAKAAGKPAPAPPPPKPPTLRQRMQGGGIVPLDELLAHRDELVAAAGQEREQIAARSQRERDAYEASRVAFAQQQLAFGELCTIQTQLADALVGRRRDAGEMQRLLEEQIGLRAKAIAKEIGESWRAVDEASQLVAAVQAGKHFGDLSHALEAAVRYGFWERIPEARYQKMSHRERQQAILNRGTCYFPVERLNVLQAFVNEQIRNLYRRAIDAAEADRSVQFAMLESGPFPTAFELCDLVDPEKPLAADRQFGCVIVQLAVPKRDGKGSMLVSGIAQLAFTNAAGVGKCITVLAVNGSISRCFPQPVTIPLASVAGSPAVAAIVQHLSDIADEALFTDEQASQLNDARRAKAKKEQRQPRLVPDTDVERQFRSLELAGELWRNRNLKWIERWRAQQAKEAERQPAAAPAKAPATGSEPAADASATAVDKPKRPRRTREAKAKAGGNGVPDSATAAPAPDVAAVDGQPPTGDTPAS